MPILKRLLAVIGLAVLIVLAIVVVRTLGFESTTGAPLDARTLPAAPPIEPALAARHLGEAVQFRTVSHQDPAEDEGGEGERDDECPLRATKDGW